MPKQNTSTRPAIAAVGTLAAMLAATNAPAADATGTLAPTAQRKPEPDRTLIKGERIEVFKSDGSVQCEPGSGIPLERMRAELTGAGIAVYDARRGDDGLFRPAVCGAGTGAINVYAIDAGALDAAVALGFRPLPR